MLDLGSAVVRECFHRAIRSGCRQERTSLQISAQNRSRFRSESSTPNGISSSVAIPSMPHSVNATSVTLCARMP